MLENIFGGIATIVIVVIVSWLIQIFGRWKLLKFFNVSKSNGVAILVSRISIPRTGRYDLNYGHVRFAGIAVSVIETIEASHLGALFDRPLTGLQDQPGIFRHLFVRDIKVNIDAAPLNLDEIPGSPTIIAIGAPEFNEVSRWAETLSPVLVLREDKIVRLDGTKITVDPNHGILQILWDAQKMRRVFYAVGENEAGTLSAVRYLCQNWRELSTLLGRKQTLSLITKLKGTGAELVTTHHP